MGVGLGLALTIAIGWLYGPTATALVSEWLSSADASYGLVLVGVASVLLWNRRTLFLSKVRADAPSLVGITILLVGLALYLIGMLGADVFLTRVSAVVVVSGAIAFVAGTSAARVLAAPLCFILLSIPPPTLVVTALTLPLQMAASRIGEAVLLLVNVPVVRDGNLLHLPSATLEVAEACSGLRSLLSLGAVAALFAWATETSWPKRVALIAAAVPIAVVVNGIRVAATGIACETWGRAAAADPWHTMTGWITFALAIGLLLSLPLLFGFQLADDELHPSMRRA